MLDLPDAAEGAALPGQNTPATLASSQGSIPLCVDLDGTLVRTDLLVEGLVSTLMNGQTFQKLPSLLTPDRALLKRRLAELENVDVTILPYNEALLAYLAEQKSLGTRLVLVTAADERLARAVAEHLGLFDLVLSSDGRTNLKGEAKARILVDYFGKGGFDYAGNDRADLAVWAQARRALVVNAGTAVKAKAKALPGSDLRFADRPSVFRYALKAMRPHQWCKNVLVFVPMVMAHAVEDPLTWLHAIAMFLSFCATASCIYLLNDIADLSADRRHPRKCRRPFASGRLSLPTGFILAAFCGITGLSLAFLVGGEAVILIYAAISIAYSLALKEFPILDVFLLATLYTIRMLGGGVATGYDVSLWLLAFSGFLFLSLALVKRAGEMEGVLRLGGAGKAARRGYLSSDLQMLISFGCASSFASSIVLALFVRSDEAMLHYGTPQLLWFIIPLTLFWQCRLWLSTTRGHMHDDPIVYAARDWVSWIVIALVLLVVIGAALGLPLNRLGIAP
ncbi:UbiA family prenyltransferase [Acidisoma cellulosilytica]|uniref:UbiA family prenyltransferase n=1 Tax=Acidisoma cellulosilyticum TaxID=2802395 RepID=A0A963Z4B0_9PROT|nr:UbiA family prenyltransferase [Acidisoma cellulosilyticum]MCB8882206.1 UbiA family prenyltransferase [Acidisoma cellulosilyticum]